MTDRHDQPGLLRERDEVQRRHHPALRVEPADQRLDARDLAALELDHRLIEEPELVVLQRALQRGLQLQPLQRGVVHRGLEQLIPVLALLLREVHRDVGVPQELLGALRHGIGLGDRDPDARADEDLGLVQEERLVEHREDPLGDVGGRHAFLAAVLQQDRELVAAEPRGGVRRAQVAEEPLADVAQDLVAGGVAERVVDRLEVVEVHEEHRDRPTVAQLAVERVLHTVGEQGAVRQPGQRVVQRLVLELLLELLPLGDVSRVQDDPPHVGVVHQVRAERFDVPHRPVPVHHAELLEPRQALIFAHRGQERHRGRPILLRDEVGEPRSFELLGIAAEYPARRRTRILDLRVRLDDHHEVRRVLHQ